MAIPSPKMPRIATFCSKPSIFPLLKNPGRKMEKTANIIRKIAKTIDC
jgi:hypothetical protein